MYRLLLVHGGMDENVHVDHMYSLIDALVQHGKPYQLHIYPRERHGLRTATASEHFDCQLAHFLLHHL